MMYSEIERKRFGMSLATAELPADMVSLCAFALACQSELKVAEFSVVLSQIWPTNPPGVSLPATVSAASR